MKTYHDEIRTVRGLRWFGSDIFELALDRGELTFTPGDCVALFAGDDRISRPYSIASGIHDEDLRFVIRHMPGGDVSSYLAGRKPGDTVRASPPFGWFRPGEHRAKRPFIFIGTGTGIAPFMAFLRSSPEATPAAFLYGARTAADLIDPEWLRQRANVQITVSREDVPGCHRGRVTDLLETLPALPEADVYLCGLDTMIDDVTSWMEERGVDITRIHRECFFNASYLA